MIAEVAGSEIQKKQKVVVVVVDGAVVEVAVAVSTTDTEMGDL